MQTGVISDYIRLYLIFLLAVVTFPLLLLGLYHSPGCPTHPGTCQKSLFLGKQAFQPGQFWQFSSTYNTLGKGDFFGTYS